MSRTFQNGLLVGSALLSVLPLMASARAETSLPEIGVEALFTNPFVPFYSTPAPIGGGDGGQYLTSVTGVTGSRMGGHGIEPVIHGQQQTQLNVLNDGAYIHGGCPNRMDPPTSYAPPESFDSITVMKGYQSVKYGPGGTGGTVLFERKPLAFTDDAFGTKATVNAGIESNGQAR
ncbi:MAG TPA: TonB-dependent receptor plug domain-containing protein, partial [Alphaproteobacteria bacterium]|nr:TonB-dependent receptor plug domain-containing protein [Alphaproteobacteria bacterium]